MKEQNVFLTSILIFSFVFFYNPVSSNAEIEFSPGIKSIVVYPDRAMMMSSDARQVRGLIWKFLQDSNNSGLLFV